jgi:hypothetical protein
MDIMSSLSGRFRERVVVAPPQKTAREFFDLAHSLHSIAAQTHRKTLPLAYTLLTCKTTVIRRRAFSSLQAPSQADPANT